MTKPFLATDRADNIFFYRVTYESVEEGENRYKRYTSEGQFTRHDLSARLVNQTNAHIEISAVFLFLFFSANRCVLT